MADRGDPDRRLTRLQKLLAIVASIVTILTGLAGLAAAGRLPLLPSPPTATAAMDFTCGGGNASGNASGGAGSSPTTHTPPSSVTYQISVKTGDIDLAGTDASVCVRLYGDQGATAEQRLASSRRDSFERGQ